MLKSMLARKFLTPIMGIVLVALNRKLDLGLTTADLAVIAGLIAAFVFGESHVDAARLSNGAADAEPAPPAPPKA